MDRVEFANRYGDGGHWFCTDEIIKWTLPVDEQEVV